MLHMYVIVLCMYLKILVVIWNIFYQHISDILDVISGVSSLGVPEVPWHPQILVDRLTLYQPEGADYAHQIILAPPDFPTVLHG